MSEILLTLMVIGAGASLLFFLMSFLRYSALNYLFPGDRYAGLSRVVGGAVLLMQAARVACAHVEGIVHLPGASILLAVFCVVTGAQLIRGGVALVRLNPR